MKKRTLKVRSKVHVKKTVRTLSRTKVRSKLHVKNVSTKKRPTLRKKLRSVPRKKTKSVRKDASRGTSKVVRRVSMDSSTRVSKALSHAKAQSQGRKDRKRSIRGPLRVSPRPQKWFRELTHEQQQRTIEKIKLAVRDVRRVARGFESADGFNLHDVGTFSRARLDKLFKTLTALRARQSAPHIEYRPRSSQAVRALQSFTAQATEIKGSKLYFIPVPDPDKTRVVIKDGRVETARKLPDGSEVVDRYFLFPRAPRSMEHAIHMTETMLQEMPDGRYMLYVHTFGAVAGTMAKNFILRELRRMDEEYKGFEGALRGFVFVGSTREEALNVYDEKETARSRIRVARAKQKNRDRYRIERKTAKRFKCRVCGKEFKSEKTALKHSTQHIKQRTLS